MKYQPGTFTTTPNVHLLKGKPSELQTIYFWLCQMADDNGVCYPGRRTLSKLTACALATVDKYILELVTLGILEKRYRPNKPGTKQKQSNMYQILIVNRVGDEKILASLQSDTTPSIETDTVTKSNKLNPITNNCEDKPRSSKNSKEEVEHEDIGNWDLYLSSLIKKAKEGFTYTSKLGKEVKVPPSPIRFFALYFLKRKGVKFKNTRSVEATLKRHYRAAKELAEFSSDMDKISEAFNKVEQFRDRNGQAYDWTLDTVVKQLTK